MILDDCDWHALSVLWLLIIIIIYTQVCHLFFSHSVKFSQLFCLCRLVLNCVSAGNNKAVDSTRYSTSWCTCKQKPGVWRGTKDKGTCYDHFLLTVQTNPHILHSLCNLSKVPWPGAVVILTAVYGLCDWSKWIDPGVPHYFISPASKAGECWAFSEETLHLLFWFFPTLKSCSFLCSHRIWLNSYFRSKILNIFWGCKSKVKNLSIMETDGCWSYIQLRNTRASLSVGWEYLQRWLILRRLNFTGRRGAGQEILGYCGCPESEQIWSYRLFLSGKPESWLELSFFFKSISSPSPSKWLLTRLSVSI